MKTANLFRNTALDPLHFDPVGNSAFKKLDPDSNQIRMQDLNIFNIYWYFPYRIRIQKSKMSGIQRIWILSTGIKYKKPNYKKKIN